jgi:hypothetical protein
MTQSLKLAPFKHNRPRYANHIANVDDKLKNKKELKQDKKESLTLFEYS